MKFDTLAKYYLEQPNFSKYLTNFNPPLDVNELEIAPVIGRKRREAKCVLEGGNGLVIEYKDKPGAYVTMNEDENGEAWNVLQVQGARSRKSYRVSSGLHWPLTFAYTFEDLATSPEAEVRHIVMPPIYGITNLEESASEHVYDMYKGFRAALKMTFSKQDGLYIRDIKRK